MSRSAGPFKLLIKWKMCTQIGNFLQRFCYLKYDFFLSLEVFSCSPKPFHSWYLYSAATLSGQVVSQYQKN